MERMKNEYQYDIGKVHSEPLFKIDMPYLQKSINFELIYKSFRFFMMVNNFNICEREHVFLILNELCRCSKVRSEKYLEKMKNETKQIPKIQDDDRIVYVNLIKE